MNDVERSVALYRCSFKIQRDTHYMLNNPDNMLYDTPLVFCYVGTFRQGRVYNK